MNKPPHFLQSKFLKLCSVHLPSSRRPSTKCPPWNSPWPSTIWLPSPRSLDLPISMQKFCLLSWAKNGLTRPPFSFLNTVQRLRNCMFENSRSVSIVPPPIQLSGKMYLSLGRYAVNGYIFQAIMEEFTLEPFHAYCVMHFQYSCHFDRNMPFPSKLEARTSKQAIPFLEKHKPCSALLIDTITES